MSKKAWIIFVVICIAFLSGLIFLARKDKVSVDGIDHTKVQAASAANGNIADHVFGKKDSKVILIEYGDFQCPYCGQAYPQLKSITEEYKDKIAFIFRNYPLTTMHPNAKSAAAAAEAAGLQGKYWEMHDKLYETQSTWSTAETNKRTDLFAQFAQQVGVKDIDKFKADMAVSSVLKKIDFDLALGTKSGVTATPTLYLDGKKLGDDVSGSVTNGDGSALTKLLDEALK